MKRLPKPSQKIWQGTQARAAMCSLTLSVFSAVACSAQGLAQSSDFGDISQSEKPPTLRGQMQPTSAAGSSGTSASGSSIDDPPDYDPNAQPTPLSSKGIQRAERDSQRRVSGGSSDGTSARSKSTDIRTNRVETPSINGDMLELIGKQPLDVPNFFMVNRTLLRGGQPTAQGFRLLKNAGVKTVINLRTEDIPIQKERDIVEGSGMKFISMPTYLVQEPTTEQFKQFIAAVQNQVNQPIYVHCQQGRDRTGTMIGAYRVACNGWKADAAFTEMYDKGFRPGFAPLMRGFYSFAQKYDKNAKAPTGDFIVKDLKMRFDRMRGKGQPSSAIPAAGQQLGPQP